MDCMLKKLSIIGCLCALVLTGCGSGFNSKYQLIYRIVDRPTNQGVTVDSIKPILESRLATLDIRGSQVHIDGNNLVVDIDADQLDRSRALGIAYQYNLSLQEPRKSLTQAEKDVIATYNEGQKSILQAAYGQAQKPEADMNEVVIANSERMNHLDKGIQGPWTVGNFTNKKYWETLNQTEVGKLTPIVETSHQIVFAKVLEKSPFPENPQFNQIRFQEVIRFLKLPEPRLDYFPVTQLRQHVVKAEVVKKDANDTYSVKNYLVKVSLNEAGKAELAKISKDYQGKPLKLFIDDFPTADITFAATNNDGWFFIDGNFNQDKANEVAQELSMAYLPVLLSLATFTVQQ